MSTAAAPQIPPRPTRSQNKAPEIPPRRVPKRLESPNRSHYPPSPFNEPRGPRRSMDLPESAAPARPPSVTIPSLGEEGREYADLNYEESAPLSQVASNSSTQTRHIGGNLPIFAPKPSLPSSSARAQVQQVTRTDSLQAANHGLGRGNEEGEPLTRLKSKSSFSRPGSAASSVERRPSVQFDEEHGPGGVGLRVPINPYVGDVQAPTPAPESYMTPAAGGPPERKRHQRTKSGREVFLPPDSYGLHGHGLIPQDKFEKDWYAKHPDALQREKEEGYYHGIGSGRGEAALSSEELNKLVRDTPSRGAGFGTKPSIPAYPDEQIGYLASDQYSSRVVSPQPTGGLYKLQSNPSQPVIESPLRKTSFPADVQGKDEFRKSSRAVSGASDKAMDDEVDDQVIHVDEPSSQYNNVSGGPESIREHENLGLHGGDNGENGGYLDENGYGVPILASDEVAKEGGGEFLQPAVPPRERRDSSYDEYKSGEQTPRSRPGSRPTSIHGMAGLARLASRHDEHEQVSTPLEDVEEYEPLFPEDEESQKPLTAADRFKQRPDALKHRFPSQDIWEDAPPSQHHVATVSTPDVPAEEQKSWPSSAFETPEQERARKGEVGEAEKAELIPTEERLAKSKFAPHLRDDMPTNSRPGMQNRFPSQDVWEDSPDSSHLVTTVGTPQADDVASPTDAAPKPSIPPRPVNRSKLGEQAMEPSVAPAQPSVPTRPPKRLHQVPPPDAQLTSAENQVSPVEGKKGPVLPDRSKPPVPARPARKESADGLTKTVSATSAGSVGSQETETAKSPDVKAKPAVPARPVGGNIANLRAGFLSDLNKRLQLGPQPAPKEEPEPPAEIEKAPLSDARKGRARGPQRRKPAASPSGISGDAPSTRSFEISPPQSVWQISEDDALIVHSREADAAAPSISERQTTGGSVDVPKAVQAQEERSPEAPPALAPPLSTNTAGESTDPSLLSTADATPRSEKTDPLDKSPNTLAKVAESDVAPSPLSKEVSPPTESTEAIPTSISEKELEEMTAEADGKRHASEEGSSPEPAAEPAA